MDSQTRARMFLEEYNELVKKHGVSLSPVASLVTESENGQVVVKAKAKIEVSFVQGWEPEISNENIELD